MITQLKQPARRKLPVIFDRSEWVVEIHPMYLSFHRHRRTKQVFTIGWDAVIAESIRMHVESERRAKRAAKGN